MTDITNFMNTYRECARNLWNAYFSSREFTWDLHSEYESIRKLLFEALVVYELDLYKECCALDTVPPPVLKVVPSATTVPILINRPSDGGGGYWDQEMDMSVGEGDVQLMFLDYFDYSQYPVKDFQFYRCRILRFPTHTEYEGREALIEASHGKVFYGE
ncbi:MAG TPA: hypothetical protein VHA06_23655 [Candidatus Angelobacter sp.]|jgi:hypothetical protein|nr:hypothetical protein [Candidatus Angelobacter sp.]